MRVLASRQGDVALAGGTVKAVFPGQEYDIPDDEALAGISSGLFEKVADEQRPASVEPTRAPRGRRAST